MLYLKSFIYLEALLILSWMLFSVFLRNEGKALLKSAPIATFSAVSAAVFLSPNYLILQAVLLFIPIACARSRAMLPPVMMMAMLALPALNQRLSIGSLYLLDWSTHATLGVGALLALAFLPGNPRRVAANWPAIAIVVLFTFIAARGTSATSWGRQIVDIGLGYGLPLFIIGYSFRLAKGVESLLLSLAFSGVALATIGIFESVRSWPIYPVLKTKYGFVMGGGFVVKFRSGLLRAYGPLDEATALGFVLVICMIAALAAGRFMKSSTGWLIIPTVILVGLAAPQSRGGILGAIAGLLAFAWYRRGFAGLGRAVMIGLPAVLVYIASFLRGGGARGVSFDAEATGEYRQRLLDRGMEEIASGPIFGDASQSVMAKLSDLTQGEGIVDIVNSYIYMGLLTGPIGLVIFCVAIWYPAVKLIGLRAPGRLDLHDSHAAAFCFSSLVSASIMLAFTSMSQRPMLLVFVASGWAIALGGARLRHGTTSPGPAQGRALVGGSPAVRRAS